MQVNLGGERVADKGLYYRSDTKHLFLRGGIVIGHCMVVDGLPHVVQSHTLDALSARVVRLSDPTLPCHPRLPTSTAARSFIQILQQHRTGTSALVTCQPQH